MTDTFYGNLSLKVNDPSLSDGDETNFSPKEISL
jgi:hypothetical protein